MAIKTKKKINSKINTCLFYEKKNVQIFKITKKASILTKVAIWYLASIFYDIQHTFYF